MSIQTVLGKISKNELGIVAPHEHIFIDMEVFFEAEDEIKFKNYAYEEVTIEKLGLLKRNPFAMLDNVRMMNEETQFNEIMEFRYAGGQTIVDATTFGIGRSPELLRKMAIKSQMNIVAGAGYYVEPAICSKIQDIPVEMLEEEIVRQVKIGIGHTNIKAGVIGEVGVSHVMYPFEKKSLIASCRAQKRTSAPLMVHVNPWSQMGLEAMEIIKKHEIDPKKVVICHVDVENKEDYILQLLDMGVYIEFDNFGKEMAVDIWNCKPGSGRFSTDRERIELIEKLLKKGYEKQILLSCDVCLKQLLHAYGGWGYDHVLSHIVPMLLEKGVAEKQIDTMLIENPAEWLNVEEVI